MNMWVDIGSQILVNALVWGMGYYTGRVKERILVHDKYLKIRIELASLLAAKNKRELKDFPHRCEWDCDICGERRIDALIGVVKYQDATKIAQLNIKHCRDNANCIEKAKTLDMWHGEKMYRMVENG